MGITATRELDYMLELAKSFGCDREQIEGFLANAYVPQPKQLEFHGMARLAQKTAVRYIMQGGTRSSSKTHTALAQVGLDDCQRHPGLKVLFLRKIQAAAKESFEDVVTKVYKGVDYRYARAEKTLYFPNGSRIIFGGYKDESDIDKYLGIEYDLIVIEECTQLSVNKIDRIDGSLRTSRDDWRSVMYLTTNPEGVGLQWARNRFVLPWRKEKDGTGNQDPTRRFIFSTYKDNIYTDPDYIIYLEGLEGALGKAWRDGDFDVFQGQAFPNFLDRTHVVEPFTIPSYWYIWMGIDDGYAKPFCGLWLTRDPMTRRVYVIQEVYQKLLTNSEQAYAIQDYTEAHWRVHRYMCDPAMFTKTHRRKAQSAADIYKECGIRLKRAENARIPGKRKVDDLFGLAPDGLPKLQIFSHCENLIEELKNLVFAEHQPEDVDTTMDDHAYDALRYAVMDKIRKVASEENKTAQTKKALAAIGRL